MDAWREVAQEVERTFDEARTEMANLVAKANATLEEWKVESLARIEKEKNDQLFLAFGRIETRLQAIEDKLKEDDDDDGLEPD